VEIPYIGTLVGVPLPPAESYQTSTAIVSEVVVPTATDLANGLRIEAGTVVEIVAVKALLNNSYLQHSTIQP
jgi:hypothetical protein